MNMIPTAHISWPSQGKPLTTSYRDKTLVWVQILSLPLPGWTYTTFSSCEKYKKIILSLKITTQSSLKIKRVLICKDANGVWPNVCSIVISSLSRQFYYSNWFCATGSWFPWTNSWWLYKSVQLKISPLKLVIP